MSKYQPYPSYKDSGVEWLGEVPKQWKAWKLAHTFNIGSGTTPKSENQAYYENGTIPWLNTGDLNDNCLYDCNKKITKIAFAECGLKIYPENSLAIAMYGATIGKLSLLKFSTTVNQACCVFSEHENKIQVNFLFYCLLGFRQHIISLAIGGGQPNINQDILKNFKIASPSISEQTAITNFLDTQTAKIDTLIAKQQRMIELLGEKRSAMISHAITKGINPDVPMKESGVEWLGEVPVHWEVKAAQFIAKITRGAILRPVDAPEYFDDNGEWAYLNISDATKCDKYLTTSKLRLSKLGSTKSARVYPDNVIITASATIGKAFINKIKVCIHDGFIPFTDIKIYKDYLYHYLSNPFLYAAMGKSNTQKNIYLDEVKRMMVTVPPMQEQIEIVDYLELKSLQMNNLIEKAENAIELMREWRTALISAAVTGKIDVRGIH
jgi:type I restriction enzyme, S subunit